MAHNEHDIQFLANMHDALGRSIAAAHAVIANGAHDEVREAAHEVLTTHSAQQATMSRLQGRLSTGGGSSAGSSAGSSGHGNGNAYGHNSADPGGELRAIASLMTAAWTPEQALAFVESTRADMSTAAINDLPDSAFAYIEPGGTKDSSGKTTPRSKRHFPIHDAAHVRNALARIRQGAQFGQQALPKVMAAAKKFGIEVAQTHNANNAEPVGFFYRDMDFQLGQTGDGLTLEGYAAVFNSPTRIDSWEGRFDEVILPGAFRDSLRSSTPVLMFEHGRHPLIGTMPLGVIQRAEEDSNGLYIEARLSDNWLIQPVRDAVRDGAVKGMSFRFSVPEGGDNMQQRSGDVDLRTINKLNVAELGPVVFPAYKPTTATVRSLVERLPDITGLPPELSPGGGESDSGLGQSTKSPLVTPRQRFDDEALRLRGVL